LHSLRSLAVKLPGDDVDAPEGSDHVGDLLALNHPGSNALNAVPRPRIQEGNHSDFTGTTAIVNSAAETLGP
jgi:hypothetical protein